MLTTAGLARRAALTTAAGVGVQQFGIRLLATALPQRRFGTACRPALFGDELQNPVHMASFLVRPGYIVSEPTIQSKSIGQTPHGQNSCLGGMRFVT